MVKNEKLYLFNVVDQSLKFEAVVLALSDVHDVLVFQLTNTTFPCYPANYGALYRGKEYRQLGVSMRREPTWKSGCVSDQMKGWFIGSSHGRNGDSGSAILDNSGRFLGMSVGKKAFCFEDNGKMDLAEVADHFTDTRIISSELIFGIAGIIDDEFQPPKQKLPHLE
ncbi:unnamed protein product [Caenorhabditis sp. 36 PRJEB53466]|nr:unnamed protein product [Caenorhabditis sp. 36 PRJEB53466]